MAVIGELATLITAKTKPFEAGMRRAQKSVQTFRSTLSAGVKSINGFTGNIVAAGASLAGITVGVSAVAQQFRELDQLAKLSARIGESTEEITRLQFAADITGAGAEKLSSGLQVMDKRLGEAAMGTGQARRAFDQLGLSTSELLRMSPAERFRAIADRISQLDSQAEKAAVTSAIFSRANQDLINTLDQGSGGLDALAKQSDAYGNTVRDDMVPEIEEANDAMRRLKAQADSLTRTLAIKIAPVASRAPLVVEAGFKSFRAVISDFIAFVIDGFAEIQDAFTSALRSVPGSFFESRAESSQQTADFFRAMSDNLRRSADTDRLAAQSALIKLDNIGKTPTPKPSPSPQGQGAGPSPFDTVSEPFLDRVTRAGRSFFDDKVGSLAVTLENLKLGAMRLGSSFGDAAEKAKLPEPVFQGVALKGSVEAAKILNAAKQGSQSVEDKQLNELQDVNEGIGIIAGAVSEGAAVVFARVESLLG